MKNTLLVAISLAVALPACNPQDIAQTAVQIADDVWQVAKVLCLVDHAQQKHVKAITVQDICQTVEQLTPYLPAAKNPALAAELVRAESNEK